MIISANAKVEVTEFVDDNVSIVANWGQVNLSDEGITFEGFPQSQFVFSIPADEVLDMCMAWMVTQQHRRNDV